MYVAITAIARSRTDHWYWPILKQQCYIWTKISWKDQKLYKQSDKCDNKKQFKDILKDDMVYATEGFTDNIPISPMISTQVKKSCAQKSLCLFTNILDVKKMLPVKLEMLNLSSRKSHTEIHHENLKKAKREFKNWWTDK